VPSQIVPTLPSVAGLDPSGASPAPFEITFRVDLPPLGAATWFIVADEEVESTDPLSPNPSTDTETFTTGRVAAAFDTATGTISSLSTENLTIQASNEFAWYPAAVAKPQPSGAYIFRPNASAMSPLPIAPSAQLSVVRGDVVDEARQRWSSWASQVVRFFKDADYVEVEWTVGPIPFEDGVGREVVSKWKTSIDSKGRLLTDSNGREMQPRQRDQRPSWKLNVTEEVAGNYYPVTAAAAIYDTTSQLSVVVDRAQGAGSLNDGEVMLSASRVRKGTIGAGNCVNVWNKTQPPSCETLKSSWGCCTGTLKAMVELGLTPSPGVPQHLGARFTECYEQIPQKCVVSDATRTKPLTLFGMFILITWSALVWTTL